MDSPRKPKPRLAGVKDNEGRTVFSRLHALFPRHGPSINSPQPAEEVQQEREAPYEHGLKIRVISWNMNDTLPKGNLDALLGEVPPYNTPDGNPAAANFELEDGTHPYHIIVVAGQECPTGLLPMGMGAVKMERSKDKDRSKTKLDESSPPKPKLSKPRRSEEEEYQLLPDAHAFQPSTASLQHTSGWSALLEDWLCKSRNIGVGPDGGVINIPASPMSERIPLPPPSPTPSRSPTLPAAGLAEVKKTAAQGTKIPPSPRRMNTFLNGHGLSHSNGHTAWNDPAATKPYVLVAKERLMGIYLAIYVHRETRPLIKGVSKSSVTTGLIGGRLGNKGGVGISMNVAGRSFLFVNAHLAAHEGRQTMRIENMEKIQAELRVDHFGDALYPRKPTSAKPDITDTFDYTFVFGDLNFRLDVSRLHADWLISRQEYPQAQEFDELRSNMRSGKLFPGFEEPAIDFPPTFKYDVPKRHHKEKEKDRGVRASIRAARRSKRKKDKDKDKLQTPKTPNKMLRPLAEQIEAGQVESGGSSSDLEEEHDEDDSDADSFASSQHLHTQSQPNLKLRPMSMKSQPTQAGSSDGDSGSDEAGTMPDTGGATGLGRMLSRGAKKGWRVLVVKAGAGVGVGGKRGSGPDVVLTGSSLSVGVPDVERDKARSQPNLIIDTAVDVGGEGGAGANGPLSPGTNGLLSPGTSVALLSPTGVASTGGLAPPPMIRGNSSTGSSMGASVEGCPEGEDQSTKGVYDTSSKQRVPSWCDRIVFKSTVLPPKPPPSLTLAPFPPSLIDEDTRLVGRMGSMFTGMRRRGSRGRKDSFPTTTPTRGRKEALAETRASPFLKRIGAGEEDEPVANGGTRPAMGSRPGSAGTDQPPSIQWPRTNPFAKLLHPNLHNSQSQGPGLIHAASMEPAPQPLAGIDLPRPRSVSTSEGEGPAPVPPPKDENRWWFFNRPRQQSEPPEPPPPEPEPAVIEEEERKRGDIVCLSYGTLDDKAMQRLGGRSDHRPVLGTYAVYI